MIKTQILLKRNISTLLRKRGHEQKDLAVWCRRSEAWLSKALTKDTAEIPVKYWDRIADFFGIATYQLIQPGISALTERRHGLERRGGRERRVGHGGLMRPTIVTHQAALVQLFSYLDEQEQADVVRMIGDRLRGRLPQPTPDIEAAVQASTVETRAASAKRLQGKGRHGPPLKTRAGIPRDTSKSLKDGP